MSIYTAPYYTGSPVWMQEAMLALRGWARGSLREGPAFRRALAEVTRTQWLDEAAMGALQLDWLRRTLRHAFDHVPFYRDRMRVAGFAPEDLRSLDDLRSLPELSKRDVFDAGERLLSQVHRGPRFKGSTSGTTGLSMTGWRDLHAINRENAFVWRQMGWAGVKPGDRRVWLRGDKVVHSAQKVPPFWRHNRAERLLMMSSYHLSEGTALSYVEAIEAYDPVMLQGYPSAVLLMARYLVSKGRRYRGSKLRSVFTSSETVTDEHRRLVQEAFGVPIFDWYGCFERMVAIGTCEHGRYHLMSDYSFTELHPQADGTCEVVGTSFDNPLMPWIRYRLGDAIVPAPQGTRCECGRAFPVIDHIVGRIEDYILAPDGRHVFMMSNVLDYLPNLLEGQIRQDSCDEVKLLLVMAPGAGLDETVARNAVLAQLGDGMKITIQRVDSIPRTGNGKLQVVVRTIPAAGAL